jgi:hypothetical protein
MLPPAISRRSEATAPPSIGSTDTPASAARRRSSGRSGRKYEPPR